MSDTHTLTAYFSVGSHLTSMQVTVLVTPETRRLLDHNGPTVIVSPLYGWQPTIERIHATADAIEYGEVDGPADFLALERGDDIGPEHIGDIVTRLFSSSSEGRPADG